MQQQDKACRCVTSRMFPHRESKCSLRTNPASSLRTIVNQTSSGISSLVSSPDSRASVPLSPTYTSPEAAKIESIEKPSAKELPVTNSKADMKLEGDENPHRNDKDDDGLAEALLAIAMLESSPSSHAQDELNEVLGNLLDFPSALEPDAFDVLPSIPEESSLPEAPLELTVDDDLYESSSAKYEDLDTPVAPPAAEANTQPLLYAPLAPPTAEVYRPTYALPCTTDELASIQAAQALQDTYNDLDALHDNTFTTNNTPTKTDTSVKDGPCRCVSSTLFPHRISKCSLGLMTGSVRSSSSANSSSSSRNNTNSDAVVPAKAQVVGNEDVPVGYSVSPQPGFDAEQDHFAPTSTDTVSEKAAGSRPCRCVSAVMFPHRANKCTLLNTNKVVTAALSSSGGSGGARVSSSSGGSKKGVARAVILTDEQVAQNLKYRQELANTPHHTVATSLLHMAGANILYLGAVCVVFIGGFGLVGHLVRLFFRVLQGVLLRR